MMNYIIQVGICWVVFYLLYHLLLKRETFHAYNRFYLFGTLVVSLLIPTLGSYAPVTEVSQSVGFVYTFDFQDAPAVDAADTIVEKSFSYWTLLWYVYLAGVIVLSLRLLIGCSQIFRFYQSGRKVKKGEITFIYNKKRHLPFSFFNYIFLSENYEIKGDVNQIIEHEMVHAHQLHSFDILVTELIQIVFWYHPILIWYKKSIKETHEYIADSTVVEHSDVKIYSAMLLSHVNSRTRHDITNQFFQKQIKNRIMMMKKNKSNTSLRFKYLLAIPVLAGLTIFTACNGDKNAITTDPNLAERSNLVVENKISDDKKDTTTVVTIPENLNKNGLEELKTITKEKRKLNIKVDKNWNPNKYAKTSGVPLPPPPPPAPPRPKKVLSKEKGVFKIVEEMPRFPGCEDMNGTIKDKDRCAKKAMIKYIYNNLEYPAQALAENKEGMAVVRFVVNTDGSIGNIDVVRDPEAGMGEAAAGVVKSFNNMSEKWIPGKQGGKAVKVQYTLPVRFKIQ